jgi:NAD(P)H-nitrite reductase large subunit
MAISTSGPLTPSAAAPAYANLRSTFKVPAIGEGGGDGAPAAERALRRALRRGETDVLVIGNGIAGCVAAIETRRYTPDADILIVTAQNHPTINTPALKQFGAGKLELEDLLAYPAGVERQLGIGMLNHRVARLEPSSRRVVLSDGQAISYQRALLATGSQPAGLPDSCPGRDFDGVLTLHRLHDYLELRRRLPGVTSVVVIGGGYHAAETALLLNHCHVAVTWLIRGRGLASHLLDVTASDLILKQLQHAGVKVRLEAEIVGVVGRIGTVAGVVTTTNDFLRCQLVVVCTGVRPSTELLRGALASSDLRHGLPVDEHLSTSLPALWAAGDVAAVRDPQSGREGARAQWYFAFQQGRLAAAALSGVPIPAETTTTALGAFWHSTQLGKFSLTVAGAPMLSEKDDPEHEVLVHAGTGAYRRLVVRQDCLVGYLAVGTCQAPGLTIKRLIDERIPIREMQRQLLSEDVDLHALFTRRRLDALRDGAVGVSAARMPVVRPTPQPAFGGI